MNISRCLVLATAGVLWATVPAFGAAARKGPASKLFVADVAGNVEINVKDKVSEVSKRTVLSADGTIIETRKPADEKDEKKNYSSMVYSNGTGMFVGSDTRVEVKKFVQEAFAPNRSDMDQEPSVSQTQAFLARGSVGLCTSKLATGSSMVYQTPQAAINVRGRRVVIEANEKYTKISMLEGESTVRAGSGSSVDLAGQVLKAGEQAIIMAAAPGVIPRIQIVPIPQADFSALDEKVGMACTAKKTVYFDSVERKTGTAAKTDEEKTDEKQPKDALTETNSPEGLGFGDPVTAFDEPAREIVAIEVAPAQLPEEFTVSKSRLK